jgi:single-strand DNA-binding protein
VTVIPSVLDPERERTSNRVELVGYLGQRPELRYTAEREAVVALSLATHCWTEGTNGPQQVTDWHRVVATGDLVATCLRLRVGELVRVVGRLRTQSWVDGRGRPRQSNEVVLADLQREPSVVQQGRLLSEEFTG